MRHITNVKREKNVYNLSLDELKSGDWLNLLKNASEMVELSYKNGYVTISDCNIKKLENSVKENGDVNGRNETAKMD